MAILRRILFMSLLVPIGMLNTVTAQTKMGYTNVELLMANMPEVEQVQRSLDNYEKELKKELMQAQDGYQRLIEEYYRLKESNGLSTEEEQRRVAEIQKLERQMQTDTQNAEYKLLKRREELLAPITTRIQSKIDEVAKEGNFTYIINQTTGGGVPSILYGMETMNVTDELAAKLGIRME